MQWGEKLKWTMNINNFKKDRKQNTCFVNSNKSQECQESLAVFKEYNLWSHSETKHEHCGNTDMAQRLQKVKD